MSTTTRYLVIELLKAEIDKTKKALESPDCDFYETKDYLTLCEDALNEVEEKTTEEKL